VDVKARLRPDHSTVPRVPSWDTIKNANEEAELDFDCMEVLALNRRNAFLKR
jgi:hypothetical protein